MGQPVATVRGTATVQGPPELASLSVAVSRSGDSAADVRHALAAASNEVVAVVAEYQAALERSASASVHVGPVFARQRRRITGYAGTWSTTLSLTDLDAVAPLVVALTALDQVELDGPWWSLRPQSPLYREARLAAIADARRRADDYAAAFGATVVDLLEVSDLDGGSSGSMPRHYALAAGLADEEPELDLEPAVQDVHGEVTVRFALSPVVLRPATS